MTHINTQSVGIDLSNLTPQQINDLRPMGGFSVIYADPPWSFSSNSAKNPGRNPMRHYDCMKTPQICALPIKTLAASNALLLLWATAPMLEHALRVMDAWGFRYKSQLVWPKSRAATGFWAMNQHELVLIGRRGQFPCERPALFKTSIIDGKTREHSRKPEWITPIIDARFPEAPKLELFGRSPRAGGVVLGNQVDKFQEAQP